MKLLMNLSKTETVAVVWNEGLSSFLEGKEVACELIK